MLHLIQQTKRRIYVGPFVLRQRGNGLIGRGYSALEYRLQRLRHSISETPISYNANMELQVQQGGAWYVIPRRSEPVGQQDTTVVLEPGMAQDEELNLSDYDLDYDAENYRIITYVDGVPFSAGFRFESVEQGLEKALEE